MATDPQSFIALSKRFSFCLYFNLKCVDFSFALKLQLIFIVLRVKKVSFRLFQRDKLDALRQRKEK